MMDEQRDTEITLGAGKLLGLFFGLVVLCAAFFGMGFSLGKSSISSTVSNLIPDTPSSTAAKSSASSGAVTAAPAPSVPETTAAETQSQPTVEPVAATTQPAAVAPAPAVPAANPSNRTAAEATHPAVAASAATGAYMVQVAAVTKQQDAAALVAALKRKQYAAFMALNPLDNFFHVQIGPLADFKQADELRARLVSDGYSPIVKR